MSIRSRFLLPVLYLAIAAACGSRGEKDARSPEGAAQGDAPGAGSVVRAAAAAPAGSYFRLRLVKVMDEHGFDRPVEAFRFLVPADWQVEGGVRWTGDIGCPYNIVEAAIRATSPDGGTGIEAFPTHTWAWNDDAMSRQVLAQGQAATGAKSCEMSPPLGAADYLKKVIVPGYRRSAEGLTVMAEEPLADMVRAYDSAVRPQIVAMGHGIDFRVDAARVRVAYTAGGRALEEWFAGAVQQIITPAPSYAALMNGQMIYDAHQFSVTATYLYSTWAARGELESKAKLFASIVASIRIDPAWQGAVEKVITNIGNAQIRGAAERSRIWSEASREISDIQRRGYEERQAVQDRLAERWSETIRGVDTYIDPRTQERVELSGGYGEAWTNNRGEYILSDSPNFNPSVELKEDWTRLEKRE
jgi:hypothetical protein